MQKAKEAVSSFTGRKGHDTEVDEQVRPTVTSETIKPHRHEESQEAVDREVHQHHHHTTVQPLEHQEVLPEKHHHRMGEVEEREFHHGNKEHSHHKLKKEHAQFQDSSRTHETTQSASQADDVQGEHVHHHVHEHVQPVVQKETVQPEVVHTTKPIHEVHHSADQHHGTSVLPTQKLSEFTSKGGDLQGRETSGHESYQGVPRTYNKEFQTNTTGSDREPGQTGLGSGSHHTGGSGLSGDGPITGKHEGQRFNNGTTGSTSGTDGYGNTSGTTGNIDDNTTGTTKKPSLLDKLNPTKDATGDGQKGFMK